MSQKKTSDQNGMPNNIDSKTFYEKNINHRTWTIVMAVLLLFIALIGFFQICSIQAGWCDGCGCAASSIESSGNDDGTIDPSCVAVWEFFVVCLIMISSALLFYYLSLVNSSKKLIAAGNLYGAASINSSKTPASNADLLAQQTKSFMDAYKAQTKGSIADLDPSILEECPACDAGSDSSSSTGSD